MILTDAKMKPPRPSSGALSASTMVYVLTVLSFMVLVSTLYVNTRLNVSKRLQKIVSSYIGDGSKSGVLTFILSNNRTTKSEQDLNQTEVGSDQHTTRRPIVLTTISHGTTSRPSECKSCFEHNFEFILNNGDVCKAGSSSIKVIVLISTIHQNTEKRRAIRETWMSPYRENNGSVRYVFLLGMTKDESRQVALETESATYRDIIQEDFVDSYNNLTLKTMMAFRWASTYCQKAEFIMKTDDDMFINVNGLLHALDSHKDILQRSVGGFCVVSANVIRDSGSKWYVSMRMYPQRTFPGYCSGTGYVTSMAVTQKVFQISPNIPFFHLEDVYVGLCINKLGFGFTRIAGFHANFIPISCSYKRADMVTIHQVNPDLMKKAWDLKC